MTFTLASNTLRSQLDSVSDVRHSHQIFIDFEDTSMKSRYADELEKNTFSDLAKNS